jgi:uncharacterized protein
MPTRHYLVYWDFFTQKEWAERQTAYEAEKKYNQDIENRTIDIMRLGEMQPERTLFFLNSNRSLSARFARRKGGEVVHFSSKARKMNHIFCLLRERSERTAT